MTTLSAEERHGYSLAWADARRKAAEDYLAYDDERPAHESAGDYMEIRFGGDTGNPDDWAEAYRVARLANRPEVSWVDRALAAEAEVTALKAELANVKSRLEWYGGVVP